jgi:hypothetical protein
MTKKIIKDLLESNLFILNKEDLTNIREALNLYANHLGEYDEELAKKIQIEVIALYSKMGANSSYNYLNKEEQDKIIRTIIKKKVKKK